MTLEGIVLQPSRLVCSTSIARRSTAETVWTQRKQDRACEWYRSSGRLPRYRKGVIPCRSPISIGVEPQP